MAVGGIRETSPEFGCEDLCAFVEFQGLLPWVKGRRYIVEGGDRGDEKID